ncbi:MAG: GDP-L-fucose synthase [Candidatus Omnitrophica bacterium]|nr:GDP-L-fucose synthase [Candidatus Omnitrophota bacterium]
MKKKLFIAGHTGLVGSALARHFGLRSSWEVVTRARKALDLTRQEAVDRFFQEVRPEAVILSAGRVGGILANSKEPAAFVYENLMMEANLIHAAWKAGVKRLINFGSTCMYPRISAQPMKPEQLGTGPLEPTSEPYAVAKWAGLTLCRAYNRQHGTRYTTVIPATVYGANDHFSLEGSHVLSALLTKLHEAAKRGLPEVTLWGTGGSRREFLFSDDLAEAVSLILEWDGSEDPIQVGSGEVVSIARLAAEISKTVGFTGAIRWDASRPDGAPEKSLESSVVRGLGWKPKTDLAGGLRKTYHWFLEHEVKRLDEVIA